MKIIPKKWLWLISICALVLLTWMSESGLEQLDRRISVERVMLLREAMQLSRYSSMQEVRSKIQRDPVLSASFEDVPDQEMSSRLLMGLQFSLQRLETAERNDLLSPVQHVEVLMGRAMMKDWQDQAAEALSILGRVRPDLLDEELRMPSVLSMAWYAMHGSLCFKLERWSEATKYFERCLEIDSDDHQAKVGYILSQEKLGALESISPQSISLAKVKQTHGRTNLRDGRIPEALSAFHSAIEYLELSVQKEVSLSLEHPWYEAIHQCAIAHQMHQEIPSALTLYDRLIRTAKKVVQPALENNQPSPLSFFLVARATALLQSGQPEQARQDLEQALALTPEAYSENLSIGQLRSTILHHLANCWMGLQRLKEAEQAFGLAEAQQRRMLQVVETHAQRMELAMTLNNQAVLFKLEGDTDRADQMLGEAMDLLRVRSSKAPAAEDSIDEPLQLCLMLGLQMQSGSMTVYTHPCLVQEDMEQEAKLMFSNAAMNRGQLYLDLGRTAACLEQWEKAAWVQEYLVEYQDRQGLMPRWTTLLQRMAWIQATHPDPAVRNGATSMRYAQKACALTGWKEPLMLQTLAAAHAELDDFQSAAQWQFRAIELAEEKDRSIFQESLKQFQTGRALRSRG